MPLSERFVRQAWGLVTAVLMLGLLLPALPASASEGVDEESESQEFDRVVRGPDFEMAQKKGEWGSGFVVSPQRRLGYLLESKNAQVSQGHGYGKLGAADLVTGEVQASLQLQRPAWTRGYGRDGQGMLLDEERGLLYVAYQPILALYVTPVTSPEYATGGKLCLTQSVDGPCPTGVHVIDAETLEIVGDIPFGEIRIEGTVLAPQLLGMQVSPTGKLLTVLTDRSTDVRVPFWLFQQETSPYYGANAALNYLAQFDPTTGRMDWIVRLDTCRGARESRDSSAQPWQVNLPGPATISFEADGDRLAAVWAACHTSSARTAVMVRIPLDSDGMPPSAPVEVRAPEPGGTPDGAPIAPSPGVESYPGPDQVNSYLVDPHTGRIMMQVLDGGDLVWWVFDIHLRSYVGTIGIGNFGSSSDSHGAEETFAFDREHGLLYSLSRPKGLLIAGVRSVPLTQALAFPEWSPLANSAASGTRMLTVLPGAADEPSRVFVHQEDLDGTERYVVLLHHRTQRPPGEPAVNEGPRSLDLDEIEGVTASVADGAARGYGARVLLVGGIEGAQRVGLADPYGAYMGVRESRVLGIGDAMDQRVDPVLGMPTRNPCMPTAREATVGFVGPTGPAVVDGSGARGSAAPLVLDGATQADADAPVSRCTGVDWAQVWGKLLFSRAPLPEPAAGEAARIRPVECSAPRGEATSEASEDAVAAPFAAMVTCEGDESSGHAYARGLRIADMDVAEALSSFRIYRDPGRGIVSRVESVARGVSLAGVVRIATVRGTAESWANGRRQPVPEEQREPGYDDNCDLERSAGTCFSRHLFGVTTPAYSCGPCGDERQLLNGLARAFGSQASIRFREPDPRLAVGAGDGSVAAVQKPDSERFADLIMNQDLLQTTVPVLEIVRYAPGNRHLTGGPPRGRQIYQFAGVEVSSSYGISCLLVYDEATGVCAPPVEEAGSVTVVLHDTEGKPLAGGAFEVRADVEGDGVLGLADVLVGEGACVTGEDGTGTCRFENLAPGSYLVSQVAAPAGFSKVEEPWVSEVAPGEARTVTFTNAFNLSTIEVSAADDAGKPLAGATFAVFADPDADGKVAPDTQPVASCTTDGSGACSMQVPTGSYVLVQTAAPAGLAPIEPVAFALTSGGQVAAVGVVNSAASVTAPEAPPAAAPPVVYQPPRAAAPPVERVAPVDPAPEVAPEVGPERDLGGTVTRVVRAPADALRLLTRSPMEAAAWTATFALLCLAAMTITRRRQATALLRG